MLTVNNICNNYTETIYWKPGYKITLPVICFVYEVYIKGYKVLNNTIPLMHVGLISYKPHAYTHTHVHTHTYTHSRTHKHTHKHTHVHIYMHTHMHTHTKQKN